MLSTKKTKYQKKSVTSKDGTTIGFRQLGHGPGVVILHGGALASQHYMKLGGALTDEFTVYIPDRRRVVGVISLRAELLTLTSSGSVRLAHWRARH